MKLSLTLTNQYWNLSTFWNLVWLSCTTYKSTRKISNIVVSSILCGLKCWAIIKQYVLNVNIIRDENIERNTWDYVKIEKNSIIQEQLSVDNLINKMYMVIYVQMQLICCIVRQIELIIAKHVKGIGKTMTTLVNDIRKWIKISENY